VAAPPPSHARPRSFTSTKVQILTQQRVPKNLWQLRLPRTHARAALPSERPIGTPLATAAQHEETRSSLSDGCVVWIKKESASAYSEVWLGVGRRKTRHTQAAESIGNAKFAQAPLPSHLQIPVCTPATKLSFTSFTAAELPPPPPPSPHDSVHSLPHVSSPCGVHVQAQQNADDKAGAMGSAGTGGGGEGGRVSLPSGVVGVVLKSGDRVDVSDALELHQVLRAEMTVVEKIVLCRAYAHVC
jgi:hypothetical protein